MVRRRTRSRAPGGAGTPCCPRQYASDPWPTLGTAEDGVDSAGGCAGAVLGGGPQVAVGVQRRGGGRVAEGALHGDDVAACRDEAGGVEVAQVVEPDVGEFRGVAGGAPAPGDVVVVHRTVTDGEQPVLWLSHGIL